MEVARQAFAAEGLSVSLDEIARRAGVGPGTLYRHFPTKEALFEAVVHERLRRLVDEARLLSGAADPAAALFTILGRVVADAAEKADLIDALASADIEVRTTVAVTAAEFRNEIGRILARAQDSGAIRNDIGIAELMAVLSGVLLALRHPASKGANPQRSLAILLDGLRPAPQANPAVRSPAPHTVCPIYRHSVIVDHPWCPSTQNDPLSRARGQSTDTIPKASGLWC